MTGLTYNTLAIILPNLFLILHLFDAAQYVCFKAQSQLKVVARALTWHALIEQRYVRDLQHLVRGLLRILDGFQGSHSSHEQLCSRVFYAKKKENQIMTYIPVNRYKKAI